MKPMIILSLFQIDVVVYDINVVLFTAAASVAAAADDDDNNDNNEDDEGDHEGDDDDDSTDVDGGLRRNQSILIYETQFRKDVHTHISIRLKSNDQHAY